MAIPAAAPPTRITPANAVVVPTAAAVAAAAVPAAAPAAPAAPAAAAPAAAAPAAAPSATCAATIAGEPVRIRASVRPSNLFIGSLPFGAWFGMEFHPYGTPSSRWIPVSHHNVKECLFRSGSRRSSLGKRVLRLRYATLRTNGGLRYAHRTNGAIIQGTGQSFRVSSGPFRRPPPDGRLTSGDCEHPSRGSPVVKNHRKRYKPGGRWRTVRRGFHRP